MGILDVVKRGFGIVHKNIKLILVLFVFNLIGAIMRMPYTPTTMAPAPGVKIPPPVVGLSILLGLVGILIFAGVLASLKDYIQTQKTGLSDFVRNGSKFFLRLLAIWVLVALTFLAIILLAGLIISIGIAIKNLVGVVIFMTLGLIIGAIGMYFFLLILMAPYILVADDIGPVAALKKSISFVRESLLKIIGLFLVIILIGAGIGFVVGIITGIATVALKGAAAKLVIGIIASAFNAYISLLLPACFLLIYLASKKTETPEAPTS